MSGPTGAQYAVSARKLTRRFGSFTAVDSLSLDVKPGEIFGFLGANGAGKTTAIRMFCGILAPTSGEAWVDGVPVGERPEHVKRRIGYMSQRFSLYDDLAVEENLTFYGGVYGMRHDVLERRCEEIVERLGLAEYRGRLTASVPAGFKQRLALASAVLHEPRIVFLDEPTAGVDPVARRGFWDVIYDLADSGTTVFVTTHYMDEAEYCGRVSIMIDGVVAAIGTPGELKTLYDAADMQEVFLKAVER
jgi:ABC-2 type transport system ATP-binding protein